MQRNKQPRALPLLMLAAALLFAFSLLLAGSSLAAMSSTSVHDHHADMAQNNTYFDATKANNHPNVVNVSVVNNAFNPAHLTVAVGTTVVWTNISTGHHTVSSGIFTSGDLRPNGVFTFTFTTAAVVHYQCDYHVDFGMIGDVTVVDSTTETPTPPPTTPTPQPTVCPNPFVDINSDPFFQAINSLYCAGVINGTSANTYTPGGTALRAEFAKIVTLGFGTPPFTPTSGQTFTDVPPTHFAYRYIETAAHSGIISGFDQAGCTSSNAQFPCFLPNHVITRGQLTKLVVNAAHYTLTTPATPSFTDVPPSQPFYAYIETAASKGVVNGYTQQQCTTHGATYPCFVPDNAIQRDEMAQIVYTGIHTP